MVTRALLSHYLLFLSHVQSLNIPNLLGTGELQMGQGGCSEMPY